MAGNVKHLYYTESIIILMIFTMLDKIEDKFDSKRGGTIIPALFMTGVIFWILALIMSVLYFAIESSFPAYYMECKDLADEIPLVVKETCIKYMNNHPDATVGEVIKHSEQIRLNEFLDP